MHGEAQLRHQKEDAKCVHRDQRFEGIQGRRLCEDRLLQGHIALLGRGHEGLDEEMSKEQRNKLSLRLYID